LFKFNYVVSEYH